MATQTILIDLAETGLNLTAQVDVVGGSSFASSVDVVESGTLAGRYSFTLSNSAGQYRVELTDDDDGGALLAVCFVETTNTSASFHTTEEISSGGSTGGGPVEVSGLTSEAIAQLAGSVIRLAPNQIAEKASLDVVRGCDYAVTDGSDLRWYFDTTDDLADATATLILKRGSTSIEFAGTVTAGSGTLWTISVEMTAEQTAALTASSDWTYAINLTLATGGIRNVRLPGQRARVLSVS